VSRNYKILVILVFNFFYYYNNNFLNNYFYFKEKKKHLIKNKYRIRIKRFYRTSSINLGKINNSLKIGEKIITYSEELTKSIFNLVTDKLTNENVSKLIKTQYDLTNKQLLDNLKKKKIDKIALKHKGIIEGISNKNEDINLEIFSTATSQDNHVINLNVTIEENKLIASKGIVPKLPIHKMPNKEIIILKDNFELKGKSMIKNILLENKIRITEKNINDLPQGLIKEINGRDKEIMELIG
jgi:hypothetical protein